MAHQGRKGELYGDMIHHLGQTDGIVQEIVLKMKKLYEHLLISKTIIVCAKSTFMIHYTLLSNNVVVRGLCVTAFIEPRQCPLTMCLSNYSCPGNGHCSFLENSSSRLLHNNQRGCHENLN